MVVAPSQFSWSLGPVAASASRRAARPPGIGPAQGAAWTWAPPGGSCCGACGRGARYKQKKELENRLAALKTVIDSAQAEEEQIREFYLLQITKWVTVSLEEIESIDQEIAILSRRDALKQGTGTRPSRAPRPPMKPFILTRDAAQAKVFGAGYPSLATMSVDDWYEQHRKRGALPDQGISQAATAGTEEQQKDQEEAKEEAEDAVRRAREWDDWKDTHPRGYGNRKNLG